jgi:endonuclease III-like uncharacterized protein
LRHNIVSETATYEDLRRLFEQALANVSLPDEEIAPASVGACHPPSRMSLTKRSDSAQVFNEMHGLIVGIGKQYCWKSSPDCEHCPLADLLPSSSGRS